MGDLNSFQARYIALRRSMVEDGIRHGIPFHTKDLQTISERISSEGSSFFKVTLPKLGKALDQGLVSGRFIPIANFRLKRGTSLPILCHQVFLMMFGEDGLLLSSPNATAIQFLRQFLLLDSKLFYEPTTEMEELAVSGFATRMSELRKVRIQTDHPVLLRAKRLLGRVLSDSILDDITPGHGPGAVAEGKNRFERWDFDSWPAKAERHYPFLLYGTSNLRNQLERGVPVRLLKRLRTKCCLVPKDFKGPRLISAESTATQYLQQGQMKALMRYFRRNIILSTSIRLEDQTFNQKAAEFSCSTGHATLDLSNASDTVSTTLVWYLLSEVPNLRRKLMSTRSDFLVWKDKEIRLTAFAPMGSAVCFPVETLVFWAISMASVMLMRSQPERWPNGETHRVCALSDYEVAREVAVFGDDIIVPIDVLPTVVSTLQEVGCSPNMSKTCYETPFRESCGSEWFAGTDVTIIRNKRYQYEHRSKIQDHPVLLDLQRKFFLQGYSSTASLLLDWAREIVPTPGIPVSWLPDPLGVLTEKYRLNIDAARKARDGLSAKNHGIYEPTIHRGLPWDLLQSQGRLNVYERSYLPSDSYPFGFDFSFRKNGARIRFNRALQRIECRVPREFNVTLNWQSGDYPRLLARLLQDSIERIATRNRKVKMAWSILPSPSGFHLLD